MNGHLPQLLYRYHYDPLDRLVGHAEPESPEQLRFYCKSRLATEINGANRHTVFQHGDLLLAQKNIQDDIFDTTLLTTDSQRSVVNALETGHQPKAIAYSPYGHLQADSGLSSLLGFNGERRDPLTGHYLLGNGYRAFNPVLMRFNSPDSWSPFGKGGLNTYAYCAGNPVGRTDPSGHVPIIHVSNLYNLIKHKGQSLTLFGFGVHRRGSVPKLVSRQAGALQPDGRSHIFTYSELEGAQRQQALMTESNNGGEAYEVFGVYMRDTPIRNFSRGSIENLNSDELALTKIIPNSHFDNMFFAQEGQPSTYSSPPTPGGIASASAAIEDHPRPATPSTSYGTRLQMSDAVSSSEFLGVSPVIARIRRGKSAQGGG